MEGRDGREGREGGMTVIHILIRLIHESAISRGCLVVVPILGSGM